MPVIDRDRRRFQIPNREAINRRSHVLARLCDAGVSIVRHRSESTDAAATINDTAPFKDSLNRGGFKQIRGSKYRAVRAEPVLIGSSKTFLSATLVKRRYWSIRGVPIMRDDTKDSSPVENRLRSLCSVVAGYKVEWDSSGRRGHSPSVHFNEFVSGSRIPIYTSFQVARIDLARLADGSTTRYDYPLINRPADRAQRAIASHADAFGGIDESKHA